MAEQQIDNAGGHIRTSTAIALITASPYALALAYYGLRSMAWGSKPKLFGVEYNTDSGADFPSRVTSLMGIVVVVIALALLASLVVLAKERHAAARWIVLGWLLLAVAVASAGARHPGEGRRCFVDAYSETQLCSSSKTIVVRDVVLRTTPAAIAIGSLLIGARRREDAQSAEVTSAQIRR